MRDHLAAQRNPSGQHEDQAAQGVDLVVLVVAGQPQPGLGLDLVQRRAGLDQPLRRLFLYPHPALGLVMLVFDLADDLFDQVLDRDQAVDAAIFVYDQRHMGPLLLHLLQQHPDGHRGRHVQHRSQHRPQGELAAGPEAVLQRQILEVDQPQRAVQRAAKDRNARKAVLAKHLDQIVQRDVQRRRDDLGLGDGHVIDAHPPQIDHAGRGLGHRSVAFIARLVLFRSRQRVEEPPEEAARLRQVAPLAADAIRLGGGVGPKRAGG